MRSATRNPGSKTLRDYLRVIFRYQGVIFTTVFSVCAATYVGLAMKTPVYDAAVKMHITAEKNIESPFYRDLASSNRFYELVKTQSEMVRSNRVVERVVRALELYDRPMNDEINFASPLKRLLLKARARFMRQNSIADNFRFEIAVRRLKNSIRIEPIQDTKMFYIYVSDYNPALVSILANVVSRSYVMFDLEQQISELKIKYGDKHPRARQLSDVLAQMEQSLDQAEIENLDDVGPATVKIVEQASFPIAPVGVSKKSVLFVAFLMSLMLGVMMAYVFDYMDQTLRTPQDIEQSFNLDVIGSIPKKKFLEKLILKGFSSRGAYARAFQRLSDELFLTLKDKQAKSVLIAGATDEEGSSTVVVNLAYALAAKGRYKVLVIDANLRFPQLHRMFRVRKPKPGLLDFLDNKVSLMDASCEVEKNLYCMPAGGIAPDPVALFESPRMRDLIELAEEAFDFVLIDCASLSAHKDAHALSGKVNKVAFVVREGKTRRQVIEHALAPLEARRENIVGFIMNGRNFEIPKLIYDMC